MSAFGSSSTCGSMMRRGVRNATSSSRTPASAKRSATRGGLRSRLVPRSSPSPHAILPPRASVVAKPIQPVALASSPQTVNPPPAPGARPASATRDAWSFHVVENPTFPLPPGFIEEQRTVYARDPPFRPRMFWFVAGACLISSLMCAELMRGHPDLRGPHGELVLPEGAYEDGVIRQPLRSIPERIQQSLPGVPIWIIRQYLAGGIVVFGGLACISVLYSPTRVITRLTQCRVRPVSSESSDKVFIKLTHAGHLLLPKRVTQFRVLDSNQIEVARIGLGRVTQSVLKVNIKGGLKRILSFDRHSYRLPFMSKLREVDPEAEVVVSLTRLEEAFGEIL